MMPQRRLPSPRKFARKSRHLPILFLTARSTNEDTLEGFKVGADDYMTKPFSMEELLVRIQAILRRTVALPDEDEQVVKSKSVRLGLTTTPRCCAAMEKNSA